MDSRSILEALKGRHPPDKWTFVPELRTVTGSKSDDTRIDAWAMQVWPSGGHRRVAYEIKYREQTSCES